jgi:hypothetical protein
MSVLRALHQIDSEDLTLRQEKRFENTFADPKEHSSLLTLKKPLGCRRA